MKQGIYVAIQNGWTRKEDIDVGGPLEYFAHGSTQPHKEEGIRLAKKIDRLNQVKSSIVPKPQEASKT